MRTLLFLGLMSTLVLGCGDDDVSDGGVGTDTGPTRDVGSVADASPVEDGGPGSDSGPDSDSGPRNDANSASDSGAGADVGAATDSGLGVDAGDNSCGGFVGAVCSSRRDFCEYAMDCGDGDGLGMCVTPPESCSRILDPVCGCDGNDYSNPCMAQMAGESVRRPGHCEVEVARCGGRGGITCPRSEYCAYTRADICGRSDATSTCMARPRRCEGNFSPVCGCDGNDYENECQANTAGVAVFRDGRCSDGP